MSGLSTSNTNLAKYYLATDTPDDDSRRTSQCVQTGHVCCNSCPEREPHIPFLINIGLIQRQQFIRLLGGTLSLAVGATIM